MTRPKICPKKSSPDPRHLNLEYIFKKSKSSVTALSPIPESWYEANFIDIKNFSWGRRTSTWWLFVEEQLLQHLIFALKFPRWLGDYLSGHGCTFTSIFREAHLFQRLHNTWIWLQNLFWLGRDIFGWAFWLGNFIWLQAFTSEMLQI